MTTRTASAGAHTPGPWRMEFAEMGGYDCMTDSFEIRAGKFALIASLDLAHYGQRHCLDAENVALEQAKANALLIAAAPTMYDYIRKKAQEGDKEAQQIIDSL